ncbi:hypothetical protein LNKW23_28120 [Paralimibaculum aggregatum]|uniref:Fe2OG dioxygenase domain-containing protein n=1 Tax=Paralimibaculum aggregatum TaxID=3036245 RepID=A0ABQ6LK20_9RHOB|nr:putative 2OG-Fe(II) oxygenase [Limibaculum sp. NKW23]GMG83599.1 hypothetical protein LNKW23_28120 [Limibaculum sp. NKW23]
MTEIAIQQAWPSTLFLCDWPEQASRAPAIETALRAEAAGFDRPVASGVATSAKPAQGLVESRLDLFDTCGDADLGALVDWFGNCIRHCVAQVNGGRVAPDRIEVEFCESWFHITNDGGFHDAHVHGNCSWCGIFYLAAGDPDPVPAGGAASAGNGINRFYSPIPGGGSVRDFGNAYLGRSYLDVQPHAGRLVLFPSFLLHSALPYRGATDRVILSFNSRSHLAPA